MFFCYFDLLVGSYLLVRMNVRALVQAFRSYCNCPRHLCCFCESGGRRRGYPPLCFCSAPTGLEKEGECYTVLPDTKTRTDASVDREISCASKLTVCCTERFPSAQHSEGPVRIGVGGYPLLRSLGGALLSAPLASEMPGRIANQRPGRKCSL